MSLCDYQRTGAGDDGKHRYCCSRCGHNRESKYPARMLHRRCPDRPPPSMGVKAIRFLTAAALHALRGSPKRTGAQIARLYAICRACGRFEKDVCRLCGCRLTRKKVYRNKLAWKDQHCDEGRW